MYSPRLIPLLALASAVLTISGPGASQQAEVTTRDRDLATYEKAGAFSIGLLDDASRRAQAMAGVRKALWQLWVDKHKGYASLRTTSKEGEISTFTYYVEPDAEGHWRVSVRVQSTFHQSGKPGMKHAYERWMVASSIRRTKDCHEHAEAGADVPDSEQLSPMNYCLLMTDRNGKTVALL